MSWKAIKEQAYTIIGAIDSNYEWEAYRRLDTAQKSESKVHATIHYPTSSPFVEEILEGSTNEYRLMSRTIEIKCRVISDTTIINQKLVVDESNDTLDKMLEDLTGAFNSSVLNSCSVGVIEVNFLNGTKEEIEGKSIYFPYLLNAEFQIIYKQVR